MDYQYLYTEIINNSKHNESNIITDYFEQHHIIPKCLGGSDEESNIVKLTAKAHFTVHHLLCKIYPNNYKLASAFNFMCCHTSNNRTRRINSRLFEIARKHFANNHPMKNPIIKQKCANSLKKYWDIKGRKPKVIKLKKHNTVKTKKYENWNAYQVEKAILYWSTHYDDIDVCHLDGYPKCRQCDKITPYRNSIYCSKSCFDQYQRENFYRTPEQHAKMVDAIKRSIFELSPEDKKNRLDKSIHSDKVDHVKRGEAISKAKKGKATKQYEIIGRRLAAMTDDEFTNYLIGISPKMHKRSNNLRNKWKNISQLEN
jgi:hypothetical protein